MVMVALGFARQCGGDVRFDWWWMPFALGRSKHLLQETSRVFMPVLTHHTDTGQPGLTHGLTPADRRLRGRCRGGPHRHTAFALLVQSAPPFSKTIAKTISEHVA